MEKILPDSKTNDAGKSGRRPIAFASGDPLTDDQPESWHGKMPPWLAERILNQRFKSNSVLPDGMTPALFIEALLEENEEEGFYSPELMTMIDSVRRGYDYFAQHDPVFFREMFSGWFEQCFEPSVDSEKIVIVLPTEDSEDDGRGLSIVAFIGGFVALGIFAIYMIAKAKGYIH